MSGKRGSQVPDPRLPLFLFHCGLHISVSQMSNQRLPEDRISSGNTARQLEGENG